MRSNIQRTKSSASCEKSNCRPHIILPITGQYDLTAKFVVYSWSNKNSPAVMVMQLKREITQVEA